MIEQQAKHAEKNPELFPGSRMESANGHELREKPRIDAHGREKTKAEGTQMAKEGVRAPVRVSGEKGPVEEKPFIA